MLHNFLRIRYLDFLKDRIIDSSDNVCLGFPGHFYLFFSSSCNFEKDLIASLLTCKTIKSFTVMVFFYILDSS